MPGPARNGIGPAGSKWAGVTATLQSVTEPGRIMLLNGPSSSGKSSIGRALLPLLDDPWFLMPVDAVSGMRSTVYRAGLDERGVAEMLRRTRRGYHRAVAAMASVGNHVIMDYPLSEPWRIDDLLVVLEGFDVTLIEVRCAAAELAPRNRAAGLALSQRVDAHGDCDIVVDTTATSPEACAAAIVTGLDTLPGVKAFDRLRARATSGPAQGVRRS